jgi:hypothetical protein
MPISDDEEMALYEAYMANNDFRMFAPARRSAICSVSKTIDIGWSISSEFSAKAASPACQKDRQRW